MRNYILVFGIILLGNIAFSQTTVNSIFSSDRLGEEGGGDHFIGVGIGNNTITMADSTTLNFYNPATYNTMATGLPLFSLGMSTRISNYAEGNNTSSGSASSIQHFALGFKIRNRFGFAFGLKPYTRRGYEFLSGETVGSDSITYFYSGKGTINEAFMGFSASLISLPNTNFSIGANAGYLYGEVSNSRGSSLYNSSSNINPGGIDIKGTSIKSFHYTIGAYLTHRFSTRHKFTLSTTIDPSQQLNGEYGEALYYSADITNSNFYDTLNLTRDDAVTISTATSLTFGLNYILSLPSDEKFGRKLNSEFSFHLSYNSTNWANFQTSFDSNPTSLLKTSKLNFGIQYTPETNFIVNSTTTKMYQRIRYRAGAYHSTLPYLTNNEQVTDLGVTFGLGLPITIQKSLSSINIGFSMGKRGVADPSLLKENFYGINFGIIIAPGSKEKWFRKSKLN